MFKRQNTRIEKIITMFQIQHHTYFKDMEQGGILFVLPSFQIGFSSEHVTFTFSWLFWEVDFCYLKGE